MANDDERQSEQASSGTAARRALIVDDDVTFHEVFTRMFSALGWTADAALGLHEAEARLAHRTYDAYVVDLKMADGMADDVMRAILERDPTGIERSVIVTGYPTVARAFSGRVPVVDKASIDDLRDFVRRVSL